MFLQDGVDRLSFKVKLGWPVDGAALEDAARATTRRYGDCSRRGRHPTGARWLETELTARDGGRHGRACHLHDERRPGLHRNRLSRLRSRGRLNLRVEVDVADGNRRW